MVPEIDSKWIYLGNGRNFEIVVTDRYGTNIEIRYIHDEDIGFIDIHWSNWDRICVPLNNLTRALYL